MKKLSLTLFAMFFVASFSFAQTGNTSEIEQKGKENTADIEQTGDRHDAGIYQGQFEGGAFGFDSKKNDATITQTGSEAGAYIWQGINNGLAAKQTAEITQHGAISNSSLEAYIVQGDALGGAKAKSERNSEATINQTGAFHTAVIQQGVGANSVGQANTAKITQSGVGSGVADVNHASIYQALNGGEAEDNYAEQVQNGFGNTAEIRQGDAAFGADAFNNTAEQFQYGNNNDAYTQQNGSNHVSYIFQDGNDNNADIQQDS